MSFQNIKYSVADGVALISLADSASLNALKAETVNELRQAFTRAENEARCAILTGEGRGFSSGANLSGGSPTMAEDGLPDAGAVLETHYNPFVTQLRDLFAQIKQQMEGSKARQVSAASREAAGRGMGRAGVTQARIGDIVRGAEAGFTGEYAKVLQSKIDADFQDKIAGIDRSQKYLDSLRDNLYRNDLTAMQREQFKANLALAYANIAAQRNNLMSQLQNSREMQRAGAGYSLLGGGV